MVFSLVDGYFLVTFIDQISPGSRDSKFPFYDTEYDLCSKLIETNQNIPVGNLQHTIAYINSTDTLSTWFPFRDWNDYQDEL